MRKAVKWIFGSLLVLLLIAIGLFQYLTYRTKQLSPENHVKYVQSEFDIEVDYSSPSKRDREIFGNIVKYGEVWRTGANEPTVFKTKSDLFIGESELKKGNYTLWTIPGEREWSVIWNTGQYGWGVNFDGKAARDPKLDVLRIQVPVVRHEFPRTEKFSITIEEYPPIMKLDWDDIYVQFNIQPLTSLDEN